MNLRKIFSGWHRKAPSIPNTVHTASNETLARDLLRAGIAHRAHAEYPDAARVLMQAIELQHDLAEAHHNLGLVYLAQGNVQDAVDVLQLAVHHGPRLAPLHCDLACALAELGDNAASSAQFEAALELDPNSGVIWLQFGNVQKKRGQLEDAISCYRAAIEREPNLILAHCQLAFILYKTGRYAESRDCHAAAIAIDPNFPELRHNFGLLLLETGYPQEALAHFERALRVLPKQLETRSCVAHALRDLGRLDEAIERYDEVLAVDPDFGDAVINRAYTLLMREEYVAGWEQYERRFSATKVLPRAFPFPEWRGEKLPRQRIFVYAEQGLGDEIMFASCVPDLLETGAELTIECSARLAPLYERSFAGAIVHGGSKEDDTAWLRTMPTMDRQVAIGSLPKSFRRSRADFPARRGYLKADAQQIDSWRKRFAAGGPALCVGISWRGGSLRTRQLLRSVTLQEMLQVLRLPDIRFIDLQYGDTRQELAALRSAHSVEVLSFSRDLADLDQLAAAICALDLVISVDNAVAHLAGALGRDVWTLLNYAAEWRYLREGTRMPWYPSARLFRQRVPRAWGPVLDEVAEALQQRPSRRV